MVFIKKKIAIFLIVLLGFNASGVSLFYCVEIGLCKIKAKYNDNLLTERNRAVIFSSHTGGFELVGDDELMANGKMYDIVMQKTTRGITLYYAASDDEEDTILTKISVCNQSSNADKSLASIKLKIYDAVYCLLKLKRQRVGIFTKTTLVSACDSPTSYQSYFQTIVLPPPQHILT